MLSVKAYSFRPNSSDRMNLCAISPHPLESISEEDTYKTTPSSRDEKTLSEKSFVLIGFTKANPLASSSKLGFEEFKIGFLTFQ